MRLKRASFLTKIVVLVLLIYMATSLLDLRGKIQSAAQALFRKGRFKFAACLFQHPGQIDVGEFQCQVGEIEAGDFKEFVDQFLQTLCLVQRDAGIAGA